VAVKPGSREHAPRCLSDTHPTTSAMEGSVGVRHFVLMETHRATAQTVESGMVIAVTAAVVALLAWTQLPTGSGPSSFPVRAPASAIAGTERRPIAAELISAFAVLRQAQSLPAPPVPHDLAVTMARQRDFLVNVSRTRFVRTGGHGFWIFPGSRGICLSRPSPGVTATCAAADDATTATEGGLRGIMPAGPGKSLVYGLAPDGNRFVSIVLVSGKVVHAPVIRNVYAATVHAAIRALIVKTKAGIAVRSPL
jgi:hypothetical protein